MGMGCGDRKHTTRSRRHFLENAKTQLPGMVPVELGIGVLSALDQQTHVQLLLSLKTGQNNGGAFCCFEAAHTQQAAHKVDKKSLVGDKVFLRAQVQATGHTPLLQKRTENI
jgi:hypothetical protein